MASVERLAARCDRAERRARESDLALQKFSAAAQTHAEEQRLAIASLRSVQARSQQLILEARRSADVEIREAVEACEIYSAHADERVAQSEREAQQQAGRLMETVATLQKQLSDASAAAQLAQRRADSAEIRAQLCVEAAEQRAAEADAGALSAVRRQNDAEQHALLVERTSREVEGRRAAERGAEKEEWARILQSAEAEQRKAENALSRLASKKEMGAIARKKAQRETKAARDELIAYQTMTLRMDVRDFEASTTPERSRAHHESCNCNRCLLKAERYEDALDAYSPGGRVNRLVTTARGVGRDGEPTVTYQGRPAQAAGEYEAPPRPSATLWTGERAGLAYYSR